MMRDVNEILTRTYFLISYLQPISTVLFIICLYINRSTHQGLYYFDGSGEILSKRVNIFIELLLFRADNGPLKISTLTRTSLLFNNYKKYLKRTYQLCLVESSRKGFSYCIKSPTEEVLCEARDLAKCDQP